MWTYEAVKALEGGAFTIQAGVGPTLPVTLVKVEDRPYRVPRPDLPRAFSMTLTGTPGILCPQGNYVLENDSLGRCELFVVPVGDRPETGEFIYQVVFN